METVVVAATESTETKRTIEIMERTTTHVGDKFQTGLLGKEDNPTFTANY